MATLLDHRYMVLRSLGQGGMGQVWLAQDTLEEREVAVKVLTEQLATERSSVLHVKQEFRLMTQLQHPNCCEVYNYGFLPEGQPYFTMEVVAGEGLEALLPCSPERFRPLLIQLLTALAYVHQRGYVHCDIKSENVRVRPDGTLKLMDFGLMVNSGANGLPIRGTLGYVAPEVVRRGEIDRRSDLYAVGCLAFEALTGALPFVKAKPIELLQAHLGEPPRLPRQLLDEQGLDWTPILAKLLAKEPMARYQAAEDVLQDLGVAPGGSVEAGLLTSQLVGRDSELATLQDALDRLERGEPGGAIALEGARGMGKTRLLAEVRIRSQLAHLPFGAGRCQLQGAAPLAGVAAAFRALLPAMREAVPTVLAELAPLVVSVLPDLACAPAPELDSLDKERVRLFDALFRLLTALARAKGAVLTLDDWQFADAPSSEFLAYVLRNMGTAPLLVVLGLRAGSPASEGLARITLGGLDAAASKDLIRSVLGAEVVPDGFADKVRAVAEHNPQLMIGALDHLVRERILRREGRQWLFSHDWDAARLPANRLAQLQRRLEAVGEEALQLARVTALAGMTVDLEELVAVSGLPEETVFGALDALHEQQLLQRAVDGTYALADDALAGLLEEGVPEAALRALHARALRHLEARHEGLEAELLPLDVATRFARHAFGAADAPRAIRHSLLAGKRSAALFAQAEARQLLEPGLALARAAGAPELRAFLQALADVNRVAVRYDEALPQYAEAIALAEAADDPRGLATLLTSRAKLHMGRDRFDEALADTERALEGLAGQGDDPVTLRALLTLARLLLYLGRTKEAVQRADEALARARSIRHDVLIAQALSLRGYLEVGLPKPDVAHGVDLLQEAGARFAELGDRHGLYNAANLLGNALMALGQYQEAWQAFDGTRQLAFELGSRDDEAMAWLNIAICALELGRLQEACEAAARTQDMATALQRKFILGLARAAGAVARARIGEPVGAQQVLSEAVELAAALKSKYMELLVRLFEVEALSYLGAWEEALEAVQACRALADETSNTESNARMAALEGSLLLSLGRAGEAGTMLADGLAMAIAAQARGDEARLRTVLARQSIAVGDFDEAGLQADAGLKLAERLGLSLIAAELHGLRGEIALAAGRAAGPDFDAMERCARVCGAPLALALAWFGQAAAAPYGPSAAQRTADAATSLEQALAGLGAEERRRFLRGAERQRVADGNHIAFSLPAPTRRRTPTGPFGLGMPGL